MKKIEEIKFGTITIGGKKYRHDVVILPSGEIKRRKGGLLIFGSHTFKKEEMEALKRAGVKKIIIGTGTNGAARISEEAKEYTKKEKIELIANVSEIAAKEFNDTIANEQNVGAIIHITC